VASFGFESDLVCFPFYSELAVLWIRNCAYWNRVFYPELACLCAYREPDLGRDWGSHMRTVTDYLLKATEFDSLASEASDPSLKKRYADLAECYRLLAADRERLVETGALPDDASPDKHAP